MEEIERILNLAVSIQQIPSPTFEEHERAAFLLSSFSSEGFIDVSADKLGNVYGRIAGVENKRPLVVCAHIDTVFPKGTDLSISREPNRIFGPGIGDNSLGVAGLFGLFWLIKNRNVTLPGDLWFVANVGEEGTGDLRGMKAVVDRFGSNPLAYIILEGMALGQIFHRGLSVQRYRIKVHTPGGHSWVNFGEPSAIHEVTEIVRKLVQIPLPDVPRTSLNVGVIKGGTSVNSIAADAYIDLDLRSESTKSLEKLITTVENTINQIQHPKVDVCFEIISQRPSGKLPADHPLVSLAQDALAARGLASHLIIGSTDANIPLSQVLPAITIGLTTGSGAHTTGEFINTEPLEDGLEQLLHIVVGSFSALE